jgi:hypothetical protein
MAGWAAETRQPIAFASDDALSPRSATPAGGPNRERPERIIDLTADRC